MKCPYSNSILVRSSSSDPKIRPPLCVTAGVEDIEIRTDTIRLDEDMQVGMRGGVGGSD